MQARIQWQDEFRLDDGLIYLNHAAVAPWPQRTRNAVIRFAEENARSGSEGYPRWIGVETRLRQGLAHLINSPTDEDIALLKSTSEALSVVAYGLPWRAGDNIVISDQEFPSNRIAWESLAEQGISVRRVDLASADTPEQALMQACDRQTRLLSISWIQYASGLRLHLESLGEFCRSRDILFCVDAIQGIGALDFDVQACQADFVMADGHKWMLGPEGVALFYVRPERRELLALKQFGWHMVERHGDFDAPDWKPAHSARRFECGSPNMLGVHALQASIELLLALGMTEVQKRVLENARYLMEQVQQSPQLRLITNPDSERHAGIVTFAHATVDANTLYRHLMSQRVMCAARCGGVRFSPHFYNTHEEIDAALAMAAGFRV